MRSLTLFEFFRNSGRPWLIQCWLWGAVVNRSQPVWGREPCWHPHPLTVPLIAAPNWHWGGAHETASAQLSGGGTNQLPQASPGKRTVANKRKSPTDTGIIDCWHRHKRVSKERGNDFQMLPQSLHIPTRKWTSIHPLNHMESDSKWLTALKVLKDTWEMFAMLGQAKLSQSWSQKRLYTGKESTNWASSKLIAFPFEQVGLRKDKDCWDGSEGNGASG